MPREVLAIVSVIGCRAAVLTGACMSRGHATEMSCDRSGSAAQTSPRLRVQIARRFGYAPAALWGRPVSTWVVNPEVRTEVQCPRKSCCKTIVANDDSYALAA